MPSLSYIGATVVDNNATSVALPAGTLPGDLLLLSIGTGGFGSAPTTTDPRIQTTVSQADGHFMIGFGRATASTSNVSVSTNDGEFNGHVILATYRIPAGAVLDYVMTASPVSSHALPVMPNNGDLGVLAFMYSQQDGSPHNADLNGNWTADLDATDTSTNQKYFSCLDGLLPADLGTPDGGWVTVAIGVTLPPPYDEALGIDVEYDDELAELVADDTDEMPSEVEVDDLGYTVSSADVEVEVSPYAPVVLTGFHLDGGPADRISLRTFDGGSPVHSTTRYLIDGGAP